jgi:hypothetical protein
MHTSPIPSFSQPPPFEQKKGNEKSLPHALKELAKFLREAAPLKNRNITQIKD